MKQLVCHHVHQDGTKCGHRWRPRLLDSLPVRCPRCTSTSWNKQPTDVEGFPVIVEETGPVTPRGASMPATIPDEVRSLFKGPNFGHLATTTPDGSPQVSVVWVDVEGDQVLVNAGEARVKVGHVRRDPRVAISITQYGNAYVFARVRGRVVELRPDEGGAHYASLAAKYAFTLPRVQEPRTIMVIEPKKITFRRVGS